MTKGLKSKNYKPLNLNKTIMTIVLLSTVQIAAATGILLYNYVNNKMYFIENGYGSLLLFIIIMAVLISSFLTVKNVSKKSKSNKQYEMVRDSLIQVEKLNNTLRGQRHDFMNHLQVVYGLMDMEEYTEARDYIEKVFNDIQKISSVLKTGNPAINALLQAKLIYCEKRNIKLELFITTRLVSLKIPSWEFCRILGNLIDNSIYALKEKDKDKLIELHLSEDIKNYYFKIKNNGPQIPTAVKKMIFEPGFTTKGSEGEGMGLAISKEILEEYGGTITVTSNNEETSFEGSVAK
jgi:two-component system, LytTR family, sensor histidine kinase AgrC